MSLTTATSGVDPQTGSYLSKEQRIAMFQASRGRGGGGGNAPGENRRSRVEPQNAIVVANKMASVVQTLQTNTQDTVQAVNVSVKENAQSIQNLYKSVQENRSAEAKVEKEETKDLRAERENALRLGKEKLIEGMSSAVAGLAGLGKKAASAALKPVMGFWDKIKALLANLAAAWAIRNLPTIISKVKEFGNWLGELKDWFPKSLTDLRGVWSIADNILRGMWRGFRRIAGRIFRIVTWLPRQLFRLTKRIFRPIGNFIIGFVRRIVNFIKPIVRKALGMLGDALGGVANAGKRGLNAVGDALGGVTSGGGGAKPGSGASPDAPKLPPAKGATDVAEEGGGFFGNIRKFLKNLGKKGNEAFSTGVDYLKGGGKNLKNAMGAIQETTTGVKPQPEKHMGWIKKAMAPLAKAYPALKGALGGLTKVVGGVLKFIPGIGFAIDLALNRGVNGDDWTTAIVAALGSSIVGGLSAAAGAKIGAGVGATIGGVAGLGIGAVPGAAIGAALGGIIAGIAGGMLGDTGARMGLDALNIGESSQSENKPASATISSSTEDKSKAMDLEGGEHTTVSASSLGISGTADSAEGLTESATNNRSGVKIEGTGESKRTTDSLIRSATSGSSTLDGMSEPGEGGTNNISVIDLPPSVIDGGGDKGEGGPIELPNMVEDVPFWQTADPAADMYRSYAASAFELAYN